MKIFFLCRTGHHTALLAAGITMGLIMGKENLKEKLSQLRGYGEIDFRDIGTPFYVGKDKSNNDIFTIGIAAESMMMERAVNEMMNIIGIDARDRHIINVSSAVSGWSRIGLILKRFHLNKLSKMFFYLGSNAEFNRVSKILKGIGLQPLRNY